MVGGGGCQVNEAMWEGQVSEAMWEGGGGCQVNVLLPSSLFMNEALKSCALLSLVML